LNAPDFWGAEQARREADEKAQREAEAKAKREAEENAKQEAEEKTKRDAIAKRRANPAQAVRCSLPSFTFFLFHQNCEPLSASSWPLLTLF
jgi:hypothetical protein